MKTTISINLGGMAFNIDDDAYALLKQYLRSLELHFAKEDATEEIMNDIESRMAELLREKINDFKQVITMSDVNTVIDILGRPEDFIEESDTNRRSTGERPGYRRMYRDVDNRYLGGVCAGIAAYYHFDSLIVRIISAILFVISMGVVGLIYLILWIVLPPARTVAEKIEMRGGKVTIENIRETVKKEFEQVKENMNL
jgi:phage shock protein PspC (stress-responsive transcriptional regulator)